MAPVEFEKKIRNALEKREIQPSQEAWKRIASRLDKEGPAPSRSRNTWWYLAAACLVLLIGARIFLTREEALPLPAPEVVTTPEQTPVENPATQEPVVEMVAATQEAPMDQDAVSQTEPEQPGLPETIADAAIAVAPEGVNQPDTLDLDARIDAEVDRLVAAVAALEAGEGTVTDAQIDSLLQAAQADIARTLPGVASESTDPMALLAEVEDDLNRSFRDDIFNRLKNGFIKVRTAVAARNQ